jgi:Molybdopterin-binding domain of aldehyde dehydrogenase
VKQFHYAEEAVVTFASAKVARLVKWVCERSEGFISDAHGRDHVTEAELALDAGGAFLGLRVRTIANMGGYLSTFGPNIPSYLYGPLLAGVYTTPAIYCEVKAVFTNTLPVDAYRGAGRPEARAGARSCQGRMSADVRHPGTDMRSTLAADQLISIRLLRRSTIHLNWVHRDPNGHAEKPIGSIWPKYSTMSWFSPSGILVVAIRTHYQPKGGRVVSSPILDELNHRYTRV